MTTRPDRQNGDGLPELTPDFLQRAATNLEFVFMNGDNLTDAQLKVVNQSVAYLKILATRNAASLPQETLDRLASLGASQEEIDAALAKVGAGRDGADGAEDFGDMPSAYLVAKRTAPPKPAPDAMREALDARQRVVIEWGERCFGIDHMRDKIVRAARFFEEAAELVQAVGLSRDHAMRAFDHVYSREAGTPAQEAGGVANTLMALCGAIDLSFDECRNHLTTTARIRQRSALSNHAQTEI
ncbi:MAG: hypothetical protein JWP25_3606 [Bradyrhizobium sp.]|nr:hypothetical protein [Bradyrhizobium sp.]